MTEQSTRQEGDFLEPLSQEPVETPNDSDRSSPSTSRLAVIFAAILLIVLAGAGWIGYRSGQQLQATQAQATLAAGLDSQWRLAEQDIAAGRDRFALQRIEYIVSIDPAYPGASERLALLRSSLAVTAPAPTITPTRRPVAEDPAAILADMKRYAEEQNWDAVIDEAARLRTLARDFEPQTVDQLLFQALRNRGLQRIQGDEVELGIADLDYAALFAPLDQEALSYREYGRMYLAGIGNYGLNWARSVSALSELYAIGPYYKDANRLLYKALVAYGLEAESYGDNCLAAEQYRFAAEMDAGADGALQGTPQAAVATADINCQLTPYPPINTPDPDATPDPNATSDPDATPDPNVTVDPALIATATPAP